MKRYDPATLEPKWQDVWAGDARYQAPDTSDKPKYYVTGMFPYPSGAGMHTGHFFEHSIVDAVARFRRSLGYNVMYPMGFDNFGLPAENYAIKTGVSPQKATTDNIANFKNQLNRVGASIDWTREVQTSEPGYYRWTQWIFTQLYERGLAYQKESLQWWCPVDKTVLANEQVEGGKCWRCGSEVEKKSMKQWFFKITDYADALLEETPALDWPDKIKTAQTNWIGRSKGAEVAFVVDGSDETITVFTTRPDTLFGATFLVLAPEHPLARELAVEDTKDAVNAYIDEAIKKSEIERQESKDKTGVFTGSYAINPLSKEKVPVWIADYVLGGYGTGAIMAVPAHDERDHEFAETFGLPVRDVVVPDFGTPIAGAEDVSGVVVIGYDTQTKQFMTALHDGKTRLVSGGRDGNESYKEAAYRELAEEAGFTEAVDMIQLGAPVYSYYHNGVKNVDRRSLGYNFLAILDSSKQGVPQLEDHEKDFTVGWFEFNELYDRVARYEGGVDHWLEGLRRAQLAAAAYEVGTTATYPCFHDDGVLINSGDFDGIPSAEARELIVQHLEREGLGREQVNYKMRDWLISRQRYWGAPIPIIHCDKDGAVPVPESDLPVLLPDVEDFAPKGDGKSPLARQTDWVNTTCPTCGGPAKRETDVMDGYACSSWYLLRYTDPKNTEQAWKPELASYWTPLDMYVGGEHAVAHLLYVRFWSHVFHDMGLVPTKEPVGRLVYHGLIQAEDGRKMSKSLGNVVDPLEIIDQGYGADALRTFELFLGPINEDSSWSSRGIAGVYRFLNRYWTLTQEYLESDKSGTPDLVKLETVLHATVKKVTADMYNLSFNTAIAALMECVNDLYKLKLNGFSDAWQAVFETLTQLIQPLAPHMAAELWQQLGRDTQLDFEPWPEYDEAKITSDGVTIVLQVNGKVRATIVVPAGTAQEELEQRALENDRVQEYVGNKKPAKVVVVPGRLVNVVV